MTSANRAAPELGITLVPVDIKSADDIKPAFARMKSEAEALIVIAGGLTYTVGTICLVVWERQVE